LSRRAIGLVAAASLVACLLGSAELTLARFHDAETVSGTFGTRTLQPPTALAGTGGTSVSLTWTPSTSGWATGYEVLRSTTSGSGYSQVGTVTPVTAAATADAPASGTWYYVLRTTFASWQSARSNETSVVVGSPPTSTGYKNCTNTVADTGGDNNGFETNPGNGCVQDGSIARDTSSGTNTTLSCTSSGKDRHRFWGYAFGLPGTVTSIDGITVRARMGLNNNAGTSIVCAQLSWNGGASWTTPQSVTFTGTGLTTYTLGGSSDTWGRSWTAAELGSASFRVRLIDVSDRANKRFDLDWVGVTVDYTP
jgi:hypothetical protein